MRSPQELISKLYQADDNIGVASWDSFGAALRWAIDPPAKTEAQIRARMEEYEKKAMSYKGVSGVRVAMWSERAGFYRWMLEAPKPVIDDKVRALVQARANKTGKVYYIRARPCGTLISAKPIGSDNEIIEPQGPPVKRPNQRIRKDLRPAMIRTAQDQRSLG